MEEKRKRKFNPWPTIVVLGLVVILFAVFALQLQMDLIDADKEIVRLKAEVASVRAMAEKNAEEAMKQSQLGRQQAEMAMEALKECKKSSRKK